ncbi:hypothetical protein GLW36_09205 [Halorubrum terrestre]|uniref:DUF1102 domain-containing protein n=1 Tax=Halorubrum distributum TaxID=29283 RepID=A0A6B1IM60_9EURY|nr:hypothetical protein [Halorubrum terrestre]MYL16820.1 hypothetical protein [Halorubrum terrestre]
MNRRRFVASLGALTAGGAAAVGTGAFTSVEASRDIGVTVSGDASALLSIAPGTPDGVPDSGNGDYATGASSSQLAVDITGSNGNVGGDGVNANSVTTFLGVFHIENQGTQEITLDVDPLLFADIDGSGFSVDEILTITLVPAPLASPVNLGVGEAQSFSVIALTVDFDGGATDVEIDNELNIEASTT